MAPHRLYFYIKLSLAFCFCSSSGTDSQDHEEQRVLYVANKNTSSPHFTQAKERFLGALAKGALAGSLAAVAGLPVNPAMGGPLGTPGVGPGTQNAQGGDAANAAGSEDAASAPPPVDLDAIEAAQTTVDEDIEKTTKLGNKLKEAIDMLSAATQSHARKGVDYSATVIQPPPPPEEQTGIELAAEATSQESLYTAPVIILLPPEPSPTEKIEFARAMACLGKMNSPEMQKARSAQLAEMATIKGTTEAQLQREISETREALSKAKSDRRRVQEELRQMTANAIEGSASQADVLFLKHDTKLADEKITILLDKLQRLDVKLGRVRSQEKAEEKKQRQLRPKRGRESEAETEEAEEEGEAEEEERFSSRDASRAKRSRRRKSEKLEKRAFAIRRGRPKHTHRERPTETVHTSSAETIDPDLLQQQIEYQQKLIEYQLEVQKQKEQERQQQQLLQAQSVYEQQQAEKKAKQSNPALAGPAWQSRPDRVANNRSTRIY